MDNWHIIHVTLEKRIKPHNERYEQSPGRKKIKKSMKRVALAGVTLTGIELEDSQNLNQKEVSTNQN